MSRQYQYQMTNRYFGLIAEGLEDLGEWELEALGCSDIRQDYRGIHFTADMNSLYRINYCSRFFTRILAPLLTFDCHSDRYLYKTAMSIEWSDFLSPNDTFAVFSTVSNSNIRHSHYAALKLKDAVADWFTENHGSRPSVDVRSPKVWLGLRIHRNKAVIRLDTSGGSLHRRGYRKQSVEAPMLETLAAAIVHLTGWDGSVPFTDPMCGSGTLLCEALMKYCRIPPAYLRSHFGFSCMPEYSEKDWINLRNEIDSNIRKLPPGLMLGNDISSVAVSAARENLSLLPSGDAVKVTQGDFQQMGELQNSLIVSNPPYGIRLGKNTDIAAFTGEFGDFLKNNCKGSTAYIYFGKRNLIKNVGLRASWKKPLRNGRLDGRLAKYELY